MTEWPLWLDAHAVTDSQFHWWLALLERLEPDLMRLAHGPEAGFVEVASFIVDILDFAVADGAWRPPYAGGMFCRYALRLAEIPLTLSIRIPGDLTVDGAARRTVDSFELSPCEAVNVAQQAEAEGDDLLKGRERDWRSLQDIQWALPQLKKLLETIHDHNIAARIQEWVEIEERLARVA